MLFDIALVFLIVFAFFWNSSAHCAIVFINIAYMIQDGVAQGKIATISLLFWLQLKVQKKVFNLLIPLHIEVRILPLQYIIGKV